MKIRRETKVAIIAILSIALFYWGYNFLKGVNVLKSTATYYAVYDDIGGLIESGVVYLNGYKVGKVAAINFDYNKPGKIVVKYSIIQGLKLPKYTTAKIISTSVISGIKDIYLVLGDSKEYHKSGDTLLAALDNGISDDIEPVKNQANEILSTIDTLAKSLNKILDEQSQKDLRDAIDHLKNITGELEKNLGENGSLSNTFEQIDEVTKTIKNQQIELANIIRNVSSFSDSIAASNIKYTIEQASGVITSTNSMLAKIDKGEGSIGMLVNSDSLYMNLNQVSQSLDSLLVDLRKNPKRYVHFSVFGKK